MSVLKKNLLGFSVALLMTSAAYADIDGGSGELHFTGQWAVPLAIFILMILSKIFH